MSLFSFHRFRRSVFIFYPVMFLDSILNSPTYTYFILFLKLLTLISYLFLHGRSSASMWLRIPNNNFMEF